MIWHNGIMIDRKNQVITHNFNKREFTGKFTQGRRLMFQTWEAMILGDMHAEELFDFLYAQDPNGGPMQGKWIFYVRLSQWRDEFDRMQLKPLRDKRGGLTYYRLIPNVV